MEVRQNVNEIKKEVRVVKETGTGKVFEDSSFLLYSH